MEPPGPGWRGPAVACGPRRRASCAGRDRQPRACVHVRQARQARRPTRAGQYHPGGSRGRAHCQSRTGNVVALATVTVKARVDGQLESVQFTEGQDVKAGQALAKIDSRVYEAQLNQALAQKAKDQASLSNAEMDLRRYTELIKDDATTQQTLDTQSALVKQLQAALLTDEAQISLARVQLDYTRITAPISGRIGGRLIDPGNIVHAADAGGLVVINQIDPIALQFTLPETAFQA